MNAYRSWILGILAGVGLLAVALALVSGGEDEWAAEPRSPRSGAPAVETPADPLRAADAKSTAGEEAIPRERLAAAESEPNATRGPRLQLEGRVVTAAGHPVPGAVVALLAAESLEAAGGRFGARGRGRGREWWRRFEPRAVAEAVRTDMEGRFRVRGDAPAAATLMVTVRHEAFAPVVVRREWRRDEGAVRLEDIVLRGGGTVVGVVRDAGGAAIPGAEVRYTRPRGRGRFGRFDALEDLVPPARSDAAGGFVLEHVPAGEVVLAAEARGFLPAASEPAALEEGGRLEVVLELQAGIALGGLVVDAAGAPVQGAEVTVMPSRGRSEGGNRRWGGRGRGRGFDVLRARRARTDEGGRFEFDAVPSGPLRVTVSHPDYVEWLLDPFEAKAGTALEVTLQRRPALSGIVVDARSGRPVTQFAVAARRAFDFGSRRRADRRDRATNRRQARSEGRVDAGAERRRRRGGREARSEGRNEEARAREAARERERAARELARRRQEELLAALLGPARTAPGPLGEPEPHPDGAFVLERLEPGRYYVDVAAPGYVPTAFGPFEVEAAAPATPLRLALEAGPVLAGVVQARDGTPVDGASVELRLPDEAAPAGSFGRGAPWRNLVIARGKSAAGGRFSFGPRRPGGYALRVEAEGFAPAESEVVLGAGGARNVLVELSEGATLYGKVTGLRDGQGGEVSIVRLEDGAVVAARVDPHTHEYRARGLPTGAYRVSFEPDGEADPRRRFFQALVARTEQPDVVLTEGASTRYDLAALPETGVVAGRVLRNGRPARGLTVRLVARAAPQASRGGRGGREERFVRAVLDRLRSDRTDAEGRFEIQDVPAGNYVLELRRGGERRRRGRGSEGELLHRDELFVAAGERVYREFAVRVGSLRVVLRGREGEPPQGARIFLVRAEETRGRPADTAQDAPSYRRIRAPGVETVVEDLPEGRWAYAVNARGCETSRGIVVVSGPGAVLEVTLAPAAKGAATKGK